MEIKFNDIIIGKYIILKKMGLDDALDIYNWRTSVSGNFMRHPEGYSLDSQLNWIKCRSEYEINYIIFDRITNKKVGTIGIYDVNSFDKITNVGRLLLSDEYLGLSNPYGLEALFLCFDYVFNELVQVGIILLNKISIIVIIGLFSFFKTILKNKIRCQLKLPLTITVLSK